ncbi:MAG: ferredoxin [Candidatus Aquicultor sp.]|nr:ferredoxin [Candidatus Aquicultor sp.]
MRIVIDIDECIGCGQCEQIAPEVFELREDSMAYMLNETPAESLAGRVDEAIEECPTAAISREA